MRRNKSKDIIALDMPRAVIATLTGITSIFVLLYIMRDIGAYGYPISILGGLLIAVLSFYPPAERGPDFQICYAVLRSPDKQPARGRAFLLVALAFIALLGIIILTPALSLYYRICLSSSSTCFYLIPLAFLAAAVFFLTLAGDLLSQRSPFPPSLFGKTGNWQQGSPARLSALIFVLFVLVLLLLSILRLIFPSSQCTWDPLLAMSLAGIIGSGLAWCSTWRWREPALQHSPDMEDDNKESGQDERF